MASTNDTKPGDKPGDRPNDKPNDRPPAPPPFDVMAACTTIVNTLKAATDDDKRRVLHSAATLLGIQTSRPAAPRAGGTGNAPPPPRGNNR